MVSCKICCVKAEGIVGDNGLRHWLLNDMQDHSSVILKFGDYCI